MALLFENSNGQFESVSEEDIAPVFTEWLRRYEEDPSSFREEFGDGEEYGSDCARYFLKLFLEDRS